MEVRRRTSQQRGLITWRDASDHAITGVTRGSNDLLDGHRSSGAPPSTIVAGRCTQYEDLLTAYAPPGGWDVMRISAYMSRESGCDPDVRSRNRDSGLLQVNDVNLTYLTRTLQKPVNRWTLLEPTQNIRAAAQLCTYWQTAGRSCYRPWGG